MKKTLFFLFIIVSFLSCKKEKSIAYNIGVVDLNSQNYFNLLVENNIPIKIKERNLITLDVIDDNVFLEGKLTNIDSLKTKLKTILDVNNKEEHLPSKKEVKLVFLKKTNVLSNHLILAQYDSDIKYDEYFKIRDIILSTYNELRNELSINKFNKPIIDLVNSKDEKDIDKYLEINSVYPIKYIEQKKK